MGQLAGKAAPKPETVWVGQLRDLWWDKGRGKEKGVEKLTLGDAWPMPTILLWEWDEPLD